MTAPFTDKKFDIGVLRADGSTKIGMMLVKDKNGVPRYQLYTDEYLASQYFSDVPGYGALPAEKELSMIQDDWRSGFGLEIYDSNDSKRYFSSDGMDMRFRGIAIAGPTPTAITKPSASTPTITDADMELGSTAWVGEDSFDATHVHGGAQALYISTPGSQSATQVLTGYTPGAEYIVTCYVWQEYTLGAQVSKVGINDGVTTTYGATTAATGAWVQLTHTKTLSLNATQCTIELNTTHSVAGDGESWWDDAAISMTSLTIGVSSCAIDFNDHTYRSFGRVLSKLNETTGTSFTLVAYMPASITDLEVFSDNKLYIALGLSNAYWEMTTAEAFTENTLVVHDFKYFCFVHTTVDTMYGSDGVNTIRSTINPANGGTAWSAQTTVGSSYYEITRLLEQSGALHIRKEDMPYYLNSSGVVKNDLAPELATEKKSTDNGKGDTAWQNKHYMCYGDQTLLESDSGTNTFLNPADYCTNLPAYNGQIYGVAGDSRYLHAVAGQASPNLFANGNFEDGDPPTDWTLTGASATLSRSSTQAKIGTYSALLTRVGTNCAIYQDLSTYASYKSKTVTMGAWIYATVASRVLLRLNDGVTDTDSSYHTGVAGWEWLTVSKTLSASASQLRCNVYILTGNTAAYIDGATLVEGSSLSQPETPNYYSTPINLLAGRYETIDSTTSWVWHPIVQIPLPKCENLFITSVYQKRAYASSTNASDPLYYIPLPTGYGNITTDANRLFKTGVMMTTPWLHGNFKNTIKGFPELELVMGHTYSANVYFTAEYEKLGDSSWTTIGNYTGTSSSMTQSKYIPVDGSSNKPKSTLFRLRFTAVTNSTNTTPILLSYHLKGLLFPTQRQIIACSIVCANEVTLRDGTIDSGSFATIEATIAEMIAATWPVTFYDIQGNTLTVKLLPVNPLSIVNKYEQGREIERIYNLLLQKCQLS